MSGRIKYLWKTSDNIKNQGDSGTAVIKVLINLDIESPECNFS